MDQLKIKFQIAGRQKLNPQAKRLLSYFESYCGEWIPLPDLMNLRMASLTRRIHEIRKAGFNVQMKDKWEARQRHVWYMLT